MKCTADMTRKATARYRISREIGKLSFKFPDQKEAYGAAKKALGMVEIAYDCELISVKEYCENRDKIIAFMAKEETENAMVGDSSDSAGE